MDRAREVTKQWAKDFEDTEDGDCPSYSERETVARWIAKGYKRAEKRYRGLEGYGLAYDVFQPIEEGAERELKHAEAGMILTVMVDVKNGRYPLAVIIHKRRAIK